MRVLSEPLHHVRPRLRVGGRRDHTAIGYGRERVAIGSLLRAYSMLASPEVDAGLLGLDSRFALREDRDWELCLVKEVHALLGTEGLLEAMPTMSVLFITRSPLYVLDSLIAAQGVETSYLDGESRHVSRRRFSDRFLDGLAPAEQGRAGGGVRGRIVRLIDTIWSMQEMFRRLGQDFQGRALVMSYEELCESPVRGFRELFEFLGIEWSRETEKEVEVTTSGSAGGDLDPYGTERLTAEQVTRPLRALTEAEAEYCRSRVRSLERCLRGIRGDGHEDPDGTKLA